MEALRCVRRIVLSLGLISHFPIGAEGIEDLGIRIDVLHGRYEEESRLSLFRSSELSLRRKSIHSGFEHIFSLGEVSSICLLPEEIIGEGEVLSRNKNSIEILTSEKIVCLYERTAKRPFLFANRTFPLAGGSDFFRLIEQKAPSGDKYTLSYNDDGFLKNIEKKNEADELVSALSFDYWQKGLDLKLSVYSSNGEMAEYYFSHVSATESVFPYVLTKVLSSKNNGCFYEYTCDGQSCRLSKKTMQEGAFIQLDYDEESRVSSLMLVEPEKEGVNYLIHYRENETEISQRSGEKKVFSHQSIKDKMLPIASFSAWIDSDVKEPAEIGSHAGACMAEPVARPEDPLRNLLVPEPETHDSPLFSLQNMKEGAAFQKGEFLPFETASPFASRSIVQTAKDTFSFLDPGFYFISLALSTSPESPLGEVQLQMDGQSVGPIAKLALAGAPVVLQAILEINETDCDLKVSVKEPISLSQGDSLTLSVWKIGQKTF